MAKQERKAREFVEGDVENPHKARGQAIRRAHPEVQQLQGRSAWTAPLAAFLVFLQLVVAGVIVGMGWSWWVSLLLGWCVGAFVAHALFAVIHEACHGMVFRSKRANQGLMLFANLPMLVPFAIPLGHYHKLHHRTQGERHRDPDLPADWELRLFGWGIVGKWLWHILFPVLQLFRLGESGQDTMSWKEPWWWLNMASQLCLVCLWVYWFGGGGLLYLGASFYFTFSLHPLSARLIQEHFVVEGRQETNSYYGVLNWLSLNLGLHTEHHDFPGIPWHRLHRLQEIAPEAYKERALHRSWTWLWLRFLFDPRLRLQDRVVRSESS